MACTVPSGVQCIPGANALPVEFLGCASPSCFPFTILLVTFATTTDSSGRFSSVGGGKRPCQSGSLACDCSGVHPGECRWEATRCVRKNRSRYGGCNWFYRNAFAGAESRTATATSLSSQTLPHLQIKSEDIVPTRCCVGSWSTTSPRHGPPYAQNASTAASTSQPLAIRHLKIMWLWRTLGGEFSRTFCG